MGKNIGFTITAKGFKFTKDVYSKERLFAIIERLFGIEQANKVNDWSGSACVDERLETDEFSVLKFEEFSF